jgi:hypothetical protein
MAKPIISIQFPSPAPPDLMHRALNFIEDVYRFLRDNAAGSVDDIDHYRSGQFIVKPSNSRYLGQVRHEITKLLRHHKLEGDAVVSRLDGERARDV